MRVKRILAAFAMAAAMCVSGCAGSAAPQAPATPVAPAERYSTASTPIGVLMADPAARAVLDRYLPEISRSDRMDMMRGATLRSIQGYALQVLTDEKLAQVDAELARLTPIARTDAAPARVANVDESRVRPYTLPDPLTLANGQPVRDAQTWWNVRRPQILNAYETNVYGRAPARPAAERFEVFDAGTPAFEGRAIRKQVLIHVSDRPNAPAIQLVEYVPTSGHGRPVPMLLMIHFEAVSSAFGDAGVRRSTIWNPATRQRAPAPDAPTMGRINIQRFLDAGIGVAAFYYGDLDPDFPGGYSLGIRAFLDGGTEETRARDAWGSIAAWAWSLSRVQDYLETDSAVDSHRVAIFGASRLGKTVLWAAANDQRFASVIACCSGKLGAAIMRRDFGEPINGTNGGDSAYWVSRNLTRFYNHEDQLPVDSNELLALIAPRPVLLQTGAHDFAGDPHGEFLAEVAAGPVYRLLGAQDLGTDVWPPIGPILNDLGYTMHAGGHGMEEGDWDVYLQFLRRHLHPER